MAISRSMYESRALLRTPQRTPVAGGGHEVRQVRARTNALCHVNQPEGSPALEGGSFPTVMTAKIYFPPKQPDIAVGGEIQITSSKNPGVIGHTYEVLSVSSTQNYQMAIGERRVSEGAT